MFTSKRKKLFRRHREYFEAVAVYGSVYSYLRRDSDADRAQQFLENYSTWNQLALLLIDEGASRDEASNLLAEVFDAAAVSDDPTGKLNDEEAGIVERRLITNTETLRDILKE